jgi:hypothetical protein
MPTTNLDKTAAESKEDAPQQGTADLFRRVKTQPISVAQCQSAPSPSRSPEKFCGSKLQPIRYSDVNRCVAHGEPSPYDFLDSNQTQPTCSPHYKLLSFLIPFVAVSLMFACEQSCAGTAIVAGLLAGSTSRIIYGTIKRFRHRH